MSLEPESITAAVSVAAVLVATIAILLQRRELRLQIEELNRQGDQLELQRIELAAQKDEHAKNVVIQDEIAAAGKNHGYLDLQIRLLLVMFEHPELRQTMGKGLYIDDENWKLHAYITCWMRLFQAGVLLGYSSIDLVEAELRDSIFSVASGPRWWRSVSQLWQVNAGTASDSDEAATMAAFVDMVERICCEAEGDLGPDADR
jgi:hypothetical protein